MSFHVIIENITSLDQKYIIVILSILLYYINFYTSNTFIFTNIIITTLVLAIFDAFLKNYLLFNVNNEYYTFVINNVITIFDLLNASTPVDKVNNISINDNILAILNFCSFFISDIKTATIPTLSRFLIIPDISPCINSKSIKKVYIDRI